jgi:hypothetical protein
MIIWKYTNFRAAGKPLLLVMVLYHVLEQTVAVVTMNNLKIAE